MTGSFPSSGFASPVRWDDPELGAVVPYAVGICSASVCAVNEATREQVEHSLNSQHPTGLNHGWHISDDPAFNTGEDNPCPCNSRPDERRHWLLTC